MLCESVRQFRRELALALLRHYRTHDEKIEEVVGVLLDKDRYAFMTSSNTPLLPLPVTRRNNNSSRERKGKHSLFSFIRLQIIRTFSELIFFVKNSWYPLENDF
ncbi:MAG: hypothetical protein AAFY76_21865 [Cyanobacteria bacterium J06649_11]